MYSAIVYPIVRYSFMLELSVLTMVLRAVDENTAFTYIGLIPMSKVVPPRKVGHHIVRPVLLTSMEPTQG